MKWYIFVLFLVNEPQAPNGYMFTDPTFVTQEQCTQAVLDKNQIPKFMQKLIVEFGMNMPRIKTISCINDDTVKLIDAYSLKEGHDV